MAVPIKISNDQRVKILSLPLVPNEMSRPFSMTIVPGQLPGKHSSFAFINQMLLGRVIHVYGGGPWTEVK